MGALTLLSTTSCVYSTLYTIRLADDKVYLASNKREPPKYDFILFGKPAGHLNGVVT